MIRDEVCYWSYCIRQKHLDDLGCYYYGFDTFRFLGCRQRAIWKCGNVDLLSKGFHSRQPPNLMYTNPVGNSLLKVCKSLFGNSSPATHYWILKSLMIYSVLIMENGNVSSMCNQLNCFCFISNTRLLETFRYTWPI